MFLQSSDPSQSKAVVRVSHGYHLPWVFHAENLSVVPRSVFFEDFLCSKPSVDINLSGWQLSSSIFDFIANHNKNLQHFLVADALGIKETDIEKMRGFSGIVHLSMRNTIEITPTLAKIFGSWKNLRELDLSRNAVSVKVFLIIGQSCSRLARLILQECKGLDDYCLQNIGDCIKRFRELSLVDVSKSQDFSDEGLLTLLQAGPNILRVLKFSQCRTISALSFTALRKPYPLIRSVDLSYTPVNQTTFEFVTEGCRNLVELNVCKCPEFDDTALAKLGVRCASLTNLNISQCIKVSDDGIVKFFENFEGSLEILNVSSCVSLSGPSAIAISESASNIKVLKMNGISKISSRELKKLWTKCLKIKVLGKPILSTFLKLFCGTPPYFPNTLLRYKLLETKS